MVRFDKALCAEMRVCREHLKPYDTVPNPDGHMQRCGYRPGVDTRWEGYDYNEWVFICACCTSEALPSGHRFSLFYCEGCRNRVHHARNWAMTSPALPLGRHSLMNGVSLPAAQADEPEAVTAFADALHGMFDSIHAIHRWQRLRLAALLDGHHEDPLLVDLLAEAAQRWTKDEAFDALIAWWTDGADPADGGWSAGGTATGCASRPTAPGNPPSGPRRPPGRG